MSLVDNYLHIWMFHRAERWIWLTISIINKYDRSVAIGYEQRGEAKGDIHAHFLRSNLDERGIL